MATVNNRGHLFCGSAIGSSECKEASNNFHKNLQTVKSGRYLYETIQVIQRHMH